MSAPLYSAWEDALHTQGYAQCVHPQCQLSFLTLAAVASHHRTCTGWSKPGEYQHHRAYHDQAHVRTDHQLDQQELYQPSDVPDVVPRTSSHQHSHVTSTTTMLSDQYSDSIFAEKEQMLSEREVEVSKLEALVQQMEVKAEQAMKARELAMWEESLHRREEMARIRMAEAERLIQEHTLLVEKSPEEKINSIPIVSPSHGPNPTPRKSVILPKSMAVSPPDQSIPPALTMSPIPTTTPSKMHLTTSPIVVPSNIKLPPSAIKLTPGCLTHLPKHRAVSSHSLTPSSAPSPNPSPSPSSAASPSPSSAPFPASSTTFYSATSPTFSSELSPTPDTAPHQVNIQTVPDAADNLAHSQLPALSPPLTPELFTNKLNLAKSSPCVPQAATSPVFQVSSEKEVGLEQTVAQGASGENCCQMKHQAVFLSSQEISIDDGASITFPFMNDTSVDADFLLGNDVVLDELVESAAGTDDSDEEYENTAMDTKEKENTVVETEEIKNTVVETEEKESTVMETEEKKNTVVEIEEKENTVMETEEMKNTVVETEVKENTVLEIEEKENPVIETEEIKNTVVETEENENTVMETEEKENTVVETEEKENTVVETEEKKNTVVETEEKENTVVETVEKENTVMKTGEKENNVLEKEDIGTETVEIGILKITSSIDHIEKLTRQTIIVDENLTSDDVQNSTFSITQVEGKDCPKSATIKRNARKRGIDCSSPRVKRRKCKDKPSTSDDNTKDDQVEPQVQDLNSVLETPSTLKDSQELKSGQTQSLSRKCGRCMLVLKSDRSWQRHRLVVHGGSARLDGDPLGQLFTLEDEQQSLDGAFCFSRKVKCPRCNDAAFDKKVELMKHLQTCQTKIENVDESSDVIVNTGDPKISQTPENVQMCKRRAAAAAKAKGKVTQIVRTKKENSDDDSDNTTDSDEEEDDYSNATSSDEDSEWEFKQVHSSTPRIRRQSSKPGKSKLVPCLERQNVEVNFRSKFYGLNKFPAFQVHISDWVPEDLILSNYLRDVNSIQFKISDFSEKDNSEDLRRLGMFEGELVKGSHVMFCGGPVCAMAWCPHDMGDQVMAVVAKMDFTPTMVNGDGGSRALIQIWKIGDLKEECQESSTFQFGIVHKYGQVWGVEWCPSGGRRENRLGLLAAACSDGTVRVWAIPSLDIMQDKGRIYQREADLSLVLEQEEEEVGQCLALSWYKGPGHNHIAASFSSGLVSVWDLSTTSPLLRKEGRVVLPWQTWLAHAGSVTSLCLYPGVEDCPRYLVTGGSDRFCRMWDLRGPMVPVQEGQRGLVTGVGWLPGWNAASVAYDDVYLQGHTMTTIMEAAYNLTKYHPIMAQNSPVLDQDTSSLAGSIATVTAAGEVVVFVMPSADRMVDHDRYLVKRVACVFRTEVVMEHNDGLNLRDYKCMKENSSLRYLDIPGKLMDYPTKEISQLLEAKCMNIEDVTCYPMASITRVAWNPNLGTHHWLASGGQAGLLRVHQVEVLRTTR